MRNATIQREYFDIPRTKIQLYPVYLLAEDIKKKIHQGQSVASVQ